MSESRSDCDLLEYDTMEADNCLPVFWRDMPTPTFAVEVLGYGYTASVLLGGEWVVGHLVGT